MFWFAVTVFVSWGGITYFLFVHKPAFQHSSNGDPKEILKETIEKLEVKVQEQIKENFVLLAKLKDLRKNENSIPSDNNIIKNSKLDLNPNIKSQDSPIKVDKPLANKSEQAGGDIEATDHDVEKKAADIVDDGGGNDKADENLDGQHVDQDTSKNQADKPVIPILLFACNRVTVSKALDLLLAYRPDKEQFPIIVTQDCGHVDTANVIKGYGDQVTHITQPDLSEPVVPPKEKKFRGYFKIARHYGWALNQTFNVFGYEQVIIVEDDLEISPDFYEYFVATLPILRKDTSLLCVSAWNDNGKQGLIDENAASLLYRTDFFPGLGWMMTKKTWEELSVKWPKSYWDDWLREPAQRRDRSCIRPEISRTKTFGKVGVSNGLFFEKHLKYIVLNQKFVPFTVMDLSFLIKKNYDDSFVKTVYETPVVSLEEFKSQKSRQYKAVRLIYHTKENYKRTAKALGIMDDFKSGVPRMAYRGIVSFSLRGQRVYLAPNLNWKGYDPKWA